VAYESKVGPYYGQRLARPGNAVSHDVVADHEHDLEPVRDPGHARPHVRPPAGGVDERNRPARQQLVNQVRAHGSSVAPADPQALELHRRPTQQVRQHRPDSRPVATMSTRR
jgi:hypothetical protein